MQGVVGRCPYLGEVKLLEGVLVVPAAFISFHNRHKRDSKSYDVKRQERERDSCVHMP